MSQCETVLAMLRMGPLCSYCFYQEAQVTHRLAARIGDLRNGGFIITSRPCKNVEHGHRSRAVVYELASSDQMALPL